MLTARSRAAVFSLLLVTLLVHTKSLAATLKINPVDNDNSRYCTTLLLKALAYTGEKYELKSTAGVGSQAREIEWLSEGKIDVIWVATSTELEAQLLPIRVPLYRGLLGHRIFIIRQGEQARFDTVKNYADVQKIILGQGRTWSDTFILEANGISVVKTARYQNLFYMLDGGRFEAFPRGVHEPWGEIKAHPDLPLTVEKNLVLIYPMPMYFFVTPGNTILANKIESGLMAMLEDGSFDEFFFNDPMIKDTLEQSNLAHRTAYRLNNPYLPKETPLDNPILWLDITKL